MFYVYMYDLFAKSCGFKINAMNMTPDGGPSMVVDYDNCQEWRAARGLL